MLQLRLLCSTDPISTRLNTFRVRKWVSEGEEKEEEIQRE